ncbi:MAG: hypothetical protein ACC661_08720, partial [Verrucomicrobiales bacterium]
MGYHPPVDYVSAARDHLAQALSRPTVGSLAVPVIQTRIPETSRKRWRDDVRVSFRRDIFLKIESIDTWLELYIAALRGASSRPSRIPPFSTFDQFPSSQEKWSRLNSTVLEERGTPLLEDSTEAIYARVILDRETAALETRIAAEDPLGLE